MQCIVFFFALTILSIASGLETRCGAQPVDSLRKEVREEKQKTQIVECTGRLLPGQGYSLYLRPGERIVKVLTWEGAAVDKGVALVQLANDDLRRQAISLHDRISKIEEENDHREILKLKIENTEEIIKKLGSQIEKERGISEKIPDYLIEGKIGEWINEKTSAERELRIFQKELSLLEKRLAKSENRRGLLEERMSEIEREIQQLLITAPFSGRVTRMGHYPERLGPGDLVLELSNEESYRVEAKIWQHQLRYIRPGDRAKIFPNFFEDYHIYGNVRSVDPSGNPSQEDGFPVFIVTIILDQKSSKLISGMAVAVEIIGASREEVLEE